MVRILHAIASTSFGGAENFFVRLVVALHHTGVIQHVLIRPNWHYTTTLHNNGVSLAELTFGSWLDLRSHLCFQREVTYFCPDIVLTWMNRATFFCPTGPFIHVGRIGGYYNLAYYQRCNHLIANTKGIVDYVLQQGWSEDRVHHLPNFVNTGCAIPCDRMTYYTPKTAALILAVGRLHANKGFDTLLKALQRIPNAYIWIVGDGEERRALENLAEYLSVRSRVRFLGWQKETATFFATADLFVCPSRYEPLGNVVLEAWAQGLPVVAASSKGPEALIHSGENGLLIPVDDVLTLAQAIQRVLHDKSLCLRLSKGGRRSFEKAFADVVLVKRYQRFFSMITGSCVESVE